MEDSLAEFSTYEEYLDSQVTPEDLFYLEDEDIARQLVELGYRTSGEVLTKEQFDARKDAVEAKRLAKLNRKVILAAGGKDITEPFLRALSDREADNRSGDVNTVLFIRTMNNSEQEVSGYIDYAHRLFTEDFELYYLGIKKLLPKQTDLSYYNWNSQDCYSQASPNFDVLTDNAESGLSFVCKKDRKILNVDPKAESPGEDSERHVIFSPDYFQTVIFDHKVRRKM